MAKKVLKKKSRNTLKSKAVPRPKTPPVPTAAAVAREKARAAALVSARAFAIEAARSLQDDHCEDIVILEMNGLSPISDFLVVATGTSDRQMRGSGDDVEKIGLTMGFEAVRKSVDDRTTWLLVDFVDVIIHVFEPNTRAFYDLEMLWGDAPRVAWEREDGETATGKVKTRRAKAGESTAFSK